MDTSLKKLSNDFFSYQPLIQFIKDSYDDFLLTGIDDIFAMNPIQYPTEEGEVMVEFKKAYLCPPSVGDQKCKGGPLWPNVCRTDKLDYVGSIMVDINFYFNGQLKKEEKNIFLCYLPVMLGSSLCNLVVQKLDREGDGEKTFASVKECGKDPLGYFIMNGTEKVLVTQEKLATNMYFVLKEKKETKKKEKGGQETVEKYICEMRSEGPDGMISLVKILIHEEIKKKTKYLAISLPFIKNGNSINIVNLIRLIFLLEGDSDALKNASETLMTYITRLTSEIQMINLVEQTIENANEVFDEDTFMSMMVKDFGYAVETTNVEEEEEEPVEDDQTFVATDNDRVNMKNNLERYFFPHMAQDYLDGKMMVLAMMTVRLMKTYFDYKPESNRDHYGVKRLETPGILLQGLFGKLFQNFVKEVANQAPKTGDIKFTTVMSTINNKKDKMSKELRNSFVKESWGVKGGKPKTGVSQALTGRLSIPYLYSMLLTVGTGTNKSSKTSKPRMLDPTQYGVICPAQISEGEACGLTKQFAVSVYVSTQQSHDAILEMLKMNTDQPLVEGEKEVGKEDVILLNGAYLGYGNATGLHKLLLLARRAKKIPFHTGLVLAKEVDKLGVSLELRIFTTKGRAVRPLYIVENGQLLMDVKGLREKDVTFQDLIKAGVVEYVDVSETEFLLIAITPDKLLNGKAYTHCEIDPSFQLGVAANVMAFAGHNPLPRVGYTAGMLKQNVSVPITSYQHRPDTGIKILRYPQKALIHSAMYDIVGLSEQPGSQISRVAVMSAGYNQDDAVMINKSSLERGMFNSDAYDIYTVETQHKEEFVTSKYPDFLHGVVPERRIKYSVFERIREKKYTEEEIRQIITPGGQLVQVTQKGKSWVYTFKKPSRVEGKYETREIERKLEEPDLFPEDFQAQGGEFLKQEKRDDKIVYTVRFPVYIMEETPVEQGDVLAVKTVTTKEGVKKESSTFMTGKRGVVDRIFRKNKGSANQIVRIRIRTSHLGDIGDKFCAPYAQKGVLGMIVPQEDMPFTQDGLTPDILVNPHAFPSRMTIGMLLELLVGKVLTCSTERVSKPLVMTKEIWERPILNIKGKKWNQLTKQEQDIVALLNQSDKDLTDKIMKKQDFKIPDKIATRRFSGQPGDSLLTLPKEEQKTFNRLHRQEEKKREQDRKEKYCDATAFRPIDMKGVEKEMFELGYQREGYEVLFSGKTGIRINAKIFVGMCNYMALKHMSEEKMHARDLGRKQPVNRQATRGKSKGGGIRFGEMEKDAVFAHGASGIIQSRLRDDSDVYHTFACKKCGNFCYFNSEAEEYVCRMCEDKIEPVKVTIPYSFQMLNNYEMAMGIKTTMEFGESNDLPDVVRREVKLQNRDVRGDDTLNVQPYVGRQSGEFISYAEPLEEMGEIQ